MLTEVLVTAQKRSERLQDFPVSVSAIQGPRLPVLRGSAKCSQYSGP